MTIGGDELIMYIQSISGEKNLPYEQVLDIFAESLAQSAKRSSNDARNAEFRVRIHPESGVIATSRCWRVLDDEELMENPQSEIMLESAREINPSANPGDFVEKPVSNDILEMRSCVLSVKQYLASRLREADRRRLLTDLDASKDELVSGQILRVLRDNGDAIVEVMRLECRLQRNQMIPREALKSGDRIRALIKEINLDTPGQPVLLTRTSPLFIKKLFEREVPEIEKGILEILSAVREPGNRAKILVRTNDPRVDPIGTCVGIRGSRVQAVTNELNGERIDIIPWTDDDYDLVLRALSPAEITRISKAKQEGVMDVLVDPERMAQAIGKSGVNVRLASELTQWKLNLHTVEEYEEAEQKELLERSTALAESLGLEEDATRILLEEGFDSLEHVAFADESDLLEVPGFQPDMVREIQSRAREQVAKEEAELAKKAEMMEQPLVDMVGDNERLVLSLARHSIFKVSDLADLAAFELVEIHDELEEDTAKDLVMQARLQAYNITPAEKEE